MSKLFVLPIFPESDYDAFRREVDQALPATHGQWREIYSAMVDEAVKKGNVVIEIEVRFAEFMAFCVKNSRSASPQVILEFVQFKQNLWAAG